MTAADRITFLSTDQLFEMIENKDPLTIVEVLAAESYAEGHIPHAISIPLEELQAKAPLMFPHKDALIVVYCARYQCHASTDAVRLLQELGYTRVFDYKAGKKGWAAADLPLQKA